MGRIIIRRAEPDDAEGIARVFAEGWRDTYSGIYTPEQIESVIAEYYPPERIADQHRTKGATRCGSCVGSTTSRSSRSLSDVGWLNSPRMQFDRHTLVVLVLRPMAGLTDEEATELQDRHLAFRAELRDRGYLIAGGPVVDQDDERLRSISIWTCDPRRRAGSATRTRQCGRAGSRPR